MKILICPDKFKDSLSSQQVSESIARGISSSFPQAELALLPLADGGEGTAEVLREATGGREVKVWVRDPLGRRIESSFAVMGDGKTVVIEMARASGLALIKSEERNPLRTSTYGTGEMIREALDQGFRDFIITIGGSATNDGGMGMAAALGARFFAASGGELPPGGESLLRVRDVDLSGLDARIGECRFVVASDVDNVLLGESGATRVYAPQKGADVRMVEELEAGMERYARLVQEAVARELVNLPGVGAAGGLGFGLVAFLQARITPGIEVVMEAVNFDARLRWCDLVVTGEGRLDAQTSRGKTVSGVIWRARGEKKPVIVLAGAVDEEVARARGKHRENLLGDNAACFSIAPGPMGREEALARTEENLFFMAAQVGVLLRNLSSPSLD